MKIICILLLKLKISNINYVTNILKQNAINDSHEFTPIFIFFFSCE